MSRTSSLGSIITMQLVNALLVFAFSIYLGVTAYPLVAFFQEREVTATYVLDVAVFVTLGLLVLVGWSSLRKGKLWAWWFAVSCDALVCLFTGYDFLSCGRQDRDCVVFAAMSLSSGIVCAFLFIPDVRERYPRIVPNATHLNRI